MCVTLDTFLINSNVWYLWLSRWLKDRYFLCTPCCWLLEPKFPALKLVLIPSQADWLVLLGIIIVIFMKPAHVVYL